MRTRGLTLVLLAALGAGAEEEVEPPLFSDEIVIRGVRTGSFQPVAGASTDWISTDTYQGEHKDLGELLAGEPGVFVRRFGAAGDRSELSIRGSTAAQVVVTLDGVRANSALTGGVDLSRLCVPLLERVELTRGAGSSQVGSGAVGGVVNLSTRAATARPTTRTAFGAGSFGTYEGSFLRADRTEHFDYAVGYCGLDTQGDFEFRQPVERNDGMEIRFEPRSATRLNNDFQQHAANLGLGRDFGPGRLQLTDYFVHSAGGEPGFDGGNDFTAGQNTEARSRDLLNLAQLRWEGSPHAWLGETFQLALHHRYERADFDDSAVVNSEPVDLSTRLQSFGFRDRHRWRFAAGEHGAELGMQLEGGHDRLRGSKQRDRQRETAAAVLDGALRMGPEWVLLSASARFEAVDGFSPEWLPQVGLVIAPWSWLRLRAQAGRAYRVPNFDELFHPEEDAVVGNPNLEPEDAWNFDAGIELLLAELGPIADLELGATGFRREIDESIVWLRVSPNRLRPENLGSATSQGIEVSTRFALTRFARFAFHQTWTRSERDGTGRRLPGQPARETLGRVELGLPHIWKWVGEVNHTGAILVNEGGNSRIPARTVWNTSAALNLVEVPGLPLHRIARELWIFLDVNNLGDEAVRDSVSFPQPGRNATAGFEVHW